MCVNVSRPNTTSVFCHGTQAGSSGDKWCQYYNPFSFQVVGSYIYFEFKNHTDIQNRVTNNYCYIYSVNNVTVKSRVDICTFLI